MKEKFFGYFPYTEKDFTEIWEDCTFVLDANILLNFYRYSTTTQEHVIKCLEQIKERLWLPYLTVEEFFNNNISVINDQNNVHAELKRAFNFNPIINKINEARHHSLDDKKEEMKNLLDECQEKLIKILEEDEGKNKLKDNEILEKILELFDGRIGEKISDNELSKLEKQIDIRYSKEIPPGYKDKAKQGFKKYGDALNWLSVIKYAKENKRNIIYITDDTKEDWVIKINGEKKGPRKELLNEFYRETEGKKVYVYNTEGFLTCFSKYIGDGEIISEEIANEIKEINSIKSEIKSSIDEASMKEIKKVEDYLEKLNNADNPFKNFQLQLEILSEQVKKRKEIEEITNNLFKAFKNSNINKNLLDNFNSESEVSIEEDDID